MNILFLIFHGFHPANGISNKILAQIEGLRNNGHQVALCYYDIHPDGHRVRIINDQVIEDYGTGKIAAFKKRICYKAILNYIVQNNIECVYIRSFHNANPSTIHFYRQLRKNGIKTVMEIPTYPYDNEYQNVPFFWHIELLVDQLFRKKMAQQLKAIITFTDKKQIFGQKTIRISNGINFNNTPLKSRINLTDKEIHFIAVAEIHYWHGFDRLICGLGNYYQHSQTRKVFFHIVGGCNETDKNILLTRIQQNQVEDYVILHGPKHGEELTTLFEKCDFAVGSLARHRSGIDKIKTLKNREYAARGIPFIYSEIDDDFEQMPYIIKAPADDSPISIENILSFHDQLHISPEEIRNSIQYLSWDQQMQKVIQEIIE